MDPRDDLESLGAGVDCAACGGLVPNDRIRVLARRDDIAFVEIHCPACRSESLGIVVTGEADAALSDGDEEGVAVGPGRAYGEFGPDDADRFRAASPIGFADVDLVHELLAQGGLAALVDGGEPPAAGSSR
ncbi:MAG TPA: hypothetical protein VFI34_05155 [Candidatus Limnocylindrales bacterium]|nr:hypothetical protein [Candidatus Limnocylindrales bacterium]